MENANLYILNHWNEYKEEGNQIFESCEECHAFLLFLQHYGQSLELAYECPNDTIDQTCLAPYNWNGTESLTEFVKTFRYAVAYEKNDFDSFVNWFVKNSREEWEIEFSPEEIELLRGQEPCWDNVLLSEEEICFHVIYC